jgi:hypothetical protein
MTDKDAERLADLLKRRADVYSPERAKPSYYGDGDIDLLRSIIDRLTQERDEAQAEVARLKRELEAATKIIAAELAHLRCSTATGEPAPDDVESRAVLIDSLNNSGISQVAKFIPDAERARRIVYSLEWLCEALDVDERESLKVHLAAALTVARREERQLHALNEAVIEAIGPFLAITRTQNVNEAITRDNIAWGLRHNVERALAARDAATGEK